MRKQRFDLKVRGQIIREIEKISNKYGLDITRHSATKWLQTIRDQLRLSKQRRALMRELKSVSDNMKKLTRR